MVLGCCSRSANYGFLLRRRAFGTLKFKLNVRLACGGESERLLAESIFCQGLQCL